MLVRSLVVLGLLLIGFAPARAAMKPLGECTLTPAASTALASCSGGVPLGATLAIIAIEGQTVRYRDDGVAPTASVGFPLLVGSVTSYAPTDFSLIRFIQASATATVTVAFYRVSP